MDNEDIERAWGADVERLTDNIDWLEKEIQRLTSAIQTEANYCKEYAKQYGGALRGVRHLERAKRLESYIAQYISTGETS